MSFWTDKKVLVTGGAGFLGSHLVRRLQNCDCRRLFTPRSHDFDLREKEALLRLYELTRPDIVIHLAAVVGGIGANRKYPGRFFYDNAIMGIQVMEFARQFDVQKFVCIGTICAYPKFVDVPFKEENLWAGYPEETNASYGLAKKMLLVQAQAYREQYGFNSIYLLPVNLYGPGDTFDAAKSHVIPALILKFMNAMSNGQRKIIAWGTGNATREFLYVEDAADGILLAAEHYNKPEPVNLGTGIEIKLRDLAHLIRDLTGFTGEIEWDTTRPDGQPRRCLDTSRAEREFRFRSTVNLREGLMRTIRWYKDQTGALCGRS